MDISTDTVISVTLTEAEISQLLADRTGCNGWTIHVQTVPAPGEYGGEMLEWEARTLIPGYSDPDAVPDDLVMDLLATEVTGETDGTVIAVIEAGALEDIIAEAILPQCGLTPAPSSLAGMIRQLLADPTEPSPRTITVRWTLPISASGPGVARPTRRARVVATGQIITVSDYGPKFYPRWWDATRGYLDTEIELAEPQPTEVTP